jgi:hypothetical protein
MRTSLRTAAAAASSAALLLAAAPAAQAGNRQPIPEEHLTVHLATCADGGTVDGTGTGSFSEHSTFADDGTLIRYTLTINFSGPWTYSTTGESVTPHGAQRISFDFVNGTVTETGNYRTLTVAGEGWQLKSAGRTVRDLATGEVISESGPKVSDIGVPEVDNDLVCGLFGVDGA